MVEVEQSGQKSARDVMNRIQVPERVLLNFQPLFIGKITFLTFYMFKSLPVNLGNGVVLFFQTL